MPNYQKFRILVIASVLCMAAICACSSEENRKTDSTSQASCQTNETGNNQVAIYGNIKPGPRYNDRIHINYIGQLSEIFNDSNHRQYAYAERLGIDPIEDLKSTYYTKRPLVYIRSNEYYQVDSLSHSLPILVPEAALLLEDIGRIFIDSLASRGADGYRIKVTSLLRTPATVKRLRRINKNATDSSTHKFATTFDISYSNFYCLDSTRTINSEDLKNLLAEVLFDLRKAGRCLVKFERQTACFHITAIK